MEGGDGVVGGVELSALRRSGIPLEGEAQAPRAVLNDCDKKYYCDWPITPVPKDFKENPERDIVGRPPTTFSWR